MIIKHQYGFNHFLRLAVLRMLKRRNLTVQQIEMRAT